MSNDKPQSGVRWFVCDEGHVHMTFVDEDDNDIVSICLDIEDWADLADSIDEEIETMIAVEESAEAVKH